MTKRNASQHSGQREEAKNCTVGLERVRWVQICREAVEGFGVYEMQKGHGDDGGSEHL